jgi:hypothetical protein
MYSPTMRACLSWFGGWKFRSRICWWLLPVSSGVSIFRRFNAALFAGHSNRQCKDGFIGAAANFSRCAFGTSLNIYSLYRVFTTPWVTCHQNSLTLGDRSTALRASHVDLTKGRVLDVGYFWYNLVTV